MGTMTCGRDMSHYTIDISGAALLNNARKLYVTEQVRLIVLSMPLRVLTTRPSAKHEI